MALGTVTKVAAWVNGNKKVKVVDVQISAGANYQTGGSLLTPAMVGLKVVQWAPPALAVSSTPTTFQVYYDVANQKVVAMGQNATPGAAVAQIQVTANTDLSGFTARMMFIGY